VANGKDIRRYSADELREMVARGEDQTDWARVDSMTEEELERAIADDPDWRDVPRDWYKDAEAVRPTPKVAISIRLDADLLDFFRAQGRGWQTRINAVLRAYADAKRRSSAR
jgi:uncharacterized protein (DUF4415 family)